MEDDDENLSEDIPIVHIPDYEITDISSDIFQPALILKDVATKDQCMYDLKLSESHVVVEEVVSGIECDQNEMDTVEKTIEVSDKTSSLNRIHICQECGLIFSCRKSLEIHKEEHSGEDKPYQCNHCKSQFSNTSHLKAHFRTHADVRPFSCDMCSASFFRKSNLNAHKRIHAGKKTYECQDCGERFSHASTLKAHYNVHVDKASASLLRVEKEFNVESDRRITDMKVSTRKVTGKVPKTCQMCSITFDTISEFRKHKKAKAVPLSLTCSKCHLSFESCLSLSAHKAEQHKIQDFKCPYCPATFKAKYFLERLHMWQHTGEKPFSCKVCGNKFTRKSSLTVHMRTHTGERPYMCSVCGACFNEKSHLKTHYRTHTGEKPYRCSVCSASFAHSGNLRSHERLHSGGKPHKCNLCPAAFMNTSHLKEHQNIHTNERPYACSQCQATFRHLGELKSHIRVHMKAYAFLCDICEKNFTSLPSLTGHKLSVHDYDVSSTSSLSYVGKVRRQFNCSECDGRFLSESKYNLHMHSKHSEMSMSGSACGKMLYSERPFCCTLCHVRFESKHDIDLHIEMHRKYKHFEMFQFDRSGSRRLLFKQVNAGTTIKEILQFSEHDLESEEGIDCFYEPDG